MKRASIAIALLAAGLLWLLLPHPLRLHPMPVFGDMAIAPVRDESPTIVLVPSEPSVPSVRRERRVTPPLPPESSSAPLITLPEARDDAYFEPPSAFEVAPYDHAGLPDWVPPQPPAPTTPPKRIYDAEVAARLLEGERKLTFPGARVIADAVRGAARLEAPAVSSGTLIVHVDSDGRVLSVKVASHRNPSAWRRIAHESARSLAGTRFTLEEPLRRGALVTVSVTSNLELPSGTGRERRFREPRRIEEEGPRWPWAPRPGPRLSWREEGSWTPLPPDMARTCPNPETTLPPCDPAHPLCPKFRFDVADIGARHARIVRTHVDVAPVPDDARDHNDVTP
ncbi:MAG TPA: hypothetical protein VFB62_18560 [Polyangiaceae bacterium]|nr:hypothetical protein [Polyangiaceae bacterium]